MAQYALAVRRRTDSTGTSNPLTGKLYCAECGASLNNHRWKAKKTGRASDDYFECPTYSHGNGCSCHAVSNEALRDLVLQSIRSVSRYAIDNEAAFAEKVHEATTIQQHQQAKQMHRESEQAKRRIAELDTILKKLFETYALGKLPEERFHALSASYEQEQKDLRSLVSEHEQQLTAYHAAEDKAERFIALAQEYREPDELTPQMINAFVEKIIVHKPEKINGQRTVQINIQFRFVGSFAIPQIEAMPTAEQRREEERKAKERERNHANYIRRKEKQLALRRSA